MSPFPSLARLAPLAALLLCAATPLARADETPAPPQDGRTPDGQKIPYKDLPKAVKEQFDKSREGFSSNPRLAGIVDRAWGFLNRDFKDLPQGDYPASAVNGLSPMVTRMVEHVDKANAWANRTDVSESQKREGVAREQGDTQRDMMKISALLNAPGGVGTAAGSSVGGDSQMFGDKLVKEVREAVRSAVTSNGGSSSPIVPPAGQFFGIPDDPNNPASMMNAAREAAQAGDTSGALSAADKAVRAGGGADALALRGGLELDAKQYGNAAKDARQALQLDPSNKEAAAVAQFAAGRVDGGGSGGDLPAGAGSAGGPASSGGGGPAAAGGGARGPSSAAQSDPVAGSLMPSDAQRSAAARLSGEQARHEAINALSLHDYSAAMAYVERALAQNPKDASLLRLRGSIYARERRYAEALADENAALAADPKDREALRAKAFLLLRSGQYREALAAANALIEADPNDAYGYALRAQAYARLGDHDSYLADIRRAAELDPYYKEAAAHAETVQKPADSDLLFLFPGEEGPAPAPAEPGRARGFSWILGASMLGGLLLALGLLRAVLDPLKGALTRVTRRGPAVGAAPPPEDDRAEAASPGEPPR